MKLRSTLATISALALCTSAQAQSYDQFKAWCHDDAPNIRKVEGCNAVIAMDREGPEGLALAYYKRGNGYYEKGWRQQAIADYDRAIELKPDYVAAYHNRANLYKALGQTERALADYDRAIEIWPEFAFGLVHRGMTYDGLGKYERALEDFNRAISLRPDYAEAYYQRGNMFHEKKQYDRAIQDMNKAILLKHDYADAFDRRGVAYKNLGQYDRALEDYDAAILLQPNGGSFITTAAGCVPSRTNSTWPFATSTRLCGSHACRRSLLNVDDAITSWASSTTPSPTMTPRFV